MNTCDNCRHLPLSSEQEPCRSCQEISPESPFVTTYHNWEASGRENDPEPAPSQAIYMISVGGLVLGKEYAALSTAMEEAERQILRSGGRETLVLRVVSRARLVVEWEKGLSA